MFYQKQILLQRVVDIYVSQFPTTSPKTKQKTNLKNFLYLSKKNSPRDPVTRDLGAPSEFKSGTPGPPSKFKSRTPGPPSKIKSGTPHLSLMNSFFSEYLIVFYLCVFFK